MTRAVTFSRAGEPADILEVSTVAAPPEPGWGHIQVRVRAFAIHPGDLLAVAMTTDVGVTQRVGTEAAGIITAIGPGVSGLTVGQRVAFFPNPGSWAETVNVPAELAVAVPESISDEVAAQLICNPITVLMLRRAAEEHPAVGYDGVVVNNAASSSVGRLFTTNAQDHHIATVSVVRSAQRAHELSTLFPEVPVFSTDAGDWRDRLSAGVGARPVAVVLDPVGGRVGTELFGLLTPGGTLISYGQLEPDPFVLQPLDLVQGSRGLRGMTVFRWLTDASATQRASDIAAALAMVSAHPQALAPAAVYRLDDIGAAVRHVSEPGKVGTVVVTV
jgi:NADPH:quinone reductase-like Zn-dependent oxidoreductase